MVSSMESHMRNKNKGVALLPALGVILVLVILLAAVLAWRALPAGSGLLSGGAAIGLSLAALLLAGAGEPDRGDWVMIETQIMRIWSRSGSEAGRSFLPAKR